MKKVLLVIIDALSSRHVQAAWDGDRLPCLKSLAEAGMFFPECTSIFPSITPAATASIATGKYPAEHGVPGAFFYDKDEDQVYFFGDDFWVILRKGFAEFFNEYMLELNGKLLAADTLYTLAEDAGFSTACINFMITSGPHRHRVDVPWLLRLWPGIPFKEEVPGPQWLYMGDFISEHASRDPSEQIPAAGGPFNRYGFQDDTTGEVLLRLAEQGTWHDLTVAYFPDNDFDSHEQGPESALSTVENVDRHLSKLIDACGGLDSFLQRFAILITGDHSQSDLAADESARAIDFGQVLNGYEIVPPGGKWSTEDEIMLCPNMRACSIYLRPNVQEDRDKIAKLMLSDHRVDQVIWSDSKSDGRQRFHVSTADRGELTFWGEDRLDGTVRDAFGNRWCIEGDLATVDGRIDSQNVVSFNSYPNALERVAQSFVSGVSGEMWATARLGYEFAVEKTEVHGAGSHGSLHVDDSTSPLIVAGCPADVPIKPPVRITDIAPICMQILKSS